MQRLNAREITSFIAVEAVFYVANTPKTVHSVRTGLRLLATAGTRTVVQLNGLIEPLT